MDKHQIVFSFDTTGSMNSCIREVRRKVEDTFTNLFKEIPGLEVALCGHGDYCDGSKRTTWLDFTSDQAKLCDFVRRVPNTGGGDAPECYELVLFEAQKLAWKADAIKAMVVIGDDVPHSPHEASRQGERALDWIYEAKRMRTFGVTLYGVQCLSRRHANDFYSRLADIGDGKRLGLDQFSDTSYLLTGICLRQVAPDRVSKFASELAERIGGLSRSMDFNLATLADRLEARHTESSVRIDKKTGGMLCPVPYGRFQILDVETDSRIDQFVKSNDLLFQRGKGFYEFTKTENIQGYKEIVLRDKKTGDMFTGNEARILIGAPLGKNARLRPAHLSEYYVFVQSTSNNRKLKRGTRFLYEVDMGR